MRVIVAAASPQGRTAEIANAIAEELFAKGLDVTVAPAAEVGALVGADAVVLGSAVCSGHWQRPAVRLTERLGTEFQGRPVWLFSTGRVGGSSRKLAQRMSAVPVELPVLMAKTGALEHRMFAGTLDHHQLRGVQRTALFLFRRLEGDFRDWTAVRAWADNIARQLGALIVH